MTGARRLRALSCIVLTASLLAPLATQAGGAREKSHNAAVPRAVHQSAPTIKPASLAYGDLTHLTFTATGPLKASFVRPLNEEASPIASAQVTASTEKGGGVELSINGNLVPNKQLGKRTVDNKTGETQYFFYGVPLKPGPNVLALVPLGADGARGAVVKETVYGPGEPAAIRASFAGPVIADGATLAPLRIWIVDRYGHPAMPGSRLDVSILAGSASFTDPSAAPVNAQTAPGQLVAPSVAQIFEEPLPPGAYVEVGLMPGTVPGALELQIAAGNARSRQTFYLQPFLRKPFVNGVLSFGAGALPNPIDGDGRYDGGGSKRLRAGFYAEGRVGKRALLSLVYESQNALSPLSSLGPFVDDPRERPYDTYGDTSVVTSRLHSKNRLYARLDSGASSIMWGQFNADIGSNDIGAYHALLSGAHLTLADKNRRVVASAFTAHNDSAFVSQTFPVLGLASLLTTLRPNIVVGSDYVQLVALNRESGAVVSETTLLRNVDYTIDYATGTLRFVNIPLPYDPFFNPQVIQLQYQYQGSGVQSQTTGGSLRIAMGPDRHTVLDLGYVNDATGTQNFALTSQTLSKQWANGSWSLSHAASAGVYPTAGTALPPTRGGSALTFFLNAHDPLNQLDVSFQDTGAGFSNPFGGLATPGLMAYHVGYTRTVPLRYTLTFSTDGQRNHGNGQNDAESDQTVALHWNANKRLAFLLGLQRHEQHVGQAGTPGPGAPNPAPGVQLIGQTQMLAQFGVDYRFSKRAGISLHQNQTISGSNAGSTQPSQTLGELSYDFGERGRVYLREFWSAAPTTTFANATNSVTYGSGANHETEIGFERHLSPATTINSNYVIDGTGDATNIYTALGIAERVKLSKNLAGNLSVQSANAVGKGAQGFVTWGGGLTYAKSDVLRASLSYQTRSGQAAGSTLYSGIGGRLSKNLSILGYIQRAYSATSISMDDKVTLAFRPADNDRMVSLFAYERSNGSNTGIGASNVISLEQLFRPTRRLELAGRYAYKLDGDGFYVAHTSLLGLRLRQTIGQRLDLGAEVRTLQVPAIRSARQSDFVAEAGYALGSNARFALGYNFSGSLDPTLTGRPLRRGAYVSVTTVLDRLFGWGK